MLELIFRRQYYLLSLVSGTGTNYRGLRADWGIGKRTARNRTFWFKIKDTETLFQKAVYLIRRRLDDGYYLKSEDCHLVSSGNHNTLFEEDPEDLDPLLLEAYQKAETLPATIKYTLCLAGSETTCCVCLEPIEKGEHAVTWFEKREEGLVLKSLCKKCGEE